MNNHQQSELMLALAELSRRYPDWRFGQLVANVAGWADQEIWNIEDEQLLAAAQAHRAQADQCEAKVARDSALAARA